MNPSASAFVPRKSPTTPNSAKADGSKLRAGASAFVPRTGGSGGGSVPPPPPPPSQGGAPPTYSSALQHTSHPASPNTGAPGSFKEHTMSPNAQPYTPTRFKGTPTSQGGPQFPSAPANPVPPAPTAETPETTSPEKKPANPNVFENPYVDSKLKSDAPVKTAPVEVPKFNSTWTLYADDHPTRPQVQIGAGAPGGTGDAAYNPVEIRTVGDIEDFWRLWRHMPPPNKIPATQSFTYYWFRKDIKPSWEDPRNKDGGTLTINVWEKDGSLQDKQAAEDAFQATLCLITGEAVTESQNINGVVMKLRKNGKWSIQLWTANTSESSHQQVYDGLKAELENILPADALSKVPFMPHNISSPTSASAAKRPKGGKPVAPKFVYKAEPMHVLS